jgi:hypothetical protein
MHAENGWEGPNRYAGKCKRNVHPKAQLGMHENSCQKVHGITPSARPKNPCKSCMGCSHQDGRKIHAKLNGAPLGLQCERAGVGGCCQCEMGEGRPNGRGASMGCNEQQNTWGMDHGSAGQGCNGNQWGITYGRTHHGVRGASQRRVATRGHSHGSASGPSGAEKKTLGSNHPFDPPPRVVRGKPQGIDHGLAPQGCNEQKRNTGIGPPPGPHSDNEKHGE